METQQAVESIEGMDRLKRVSTIGDVLKEWPDAAPFLTEKGIHCVGCNVSAFETIEEGFRSHGMTEEQIDDTIAEVNSQLDAFLKSKPTKDEKVCDPSTLTLGLTDLAVEKVLGVMKNENKDSKETVLRIAVLAGGCSGFKYDFSFAPLDKKEDDVVIEQGGLTVLVDKKSLAFMNGSTVDYSEGLHGAGFVVKNPEAKSGCGCGKSFN
jgi:iron-sulfur cluster assembly accessory protein